MASIASIHAKRILDSRGEWTIEVRVTLKDARYCIASVPQGKSVGTHEAHAVSARLAVKHIENILGPLLKGKDPAKQKSIDASMIRADGTPDKSSIGGNALLGVSIAVARAGALVKKIPLWKHIRLFSGLSVSSRAVPRLYINVINGGLHAGNNLDFQEYLIIPKAKTIAESIRIGTTLYHALGMYLTKLKGKGAGNLGDEGGYAPNFKTNLEPLVILQKVAKVAGLQHKVDFGLDAAGSNVHMEQKKLFAIYQTMRKKFHLFYLEDPFGEEAFDEFARIHDLLGFRVLVAGDDLTTTNIARMNLTEIRRSANSVIIKPNQIGTVSEAVGAVRLARSYGWAVIASHRSGETEDDFIADFAYGVGADGLKLGAPARGERIAKYNRLLEIEREK